MGKHQKTIQRMDSSPTPADIRWDELVGALTHLGYKELTGSGSRRKFHNPKTGALICCHKPHPGSIVPRYCIENVVEHLKDHNLIKSRG